MADNKHCRFEDMLHAYELGMLRDDDLRAFEEHLMDCDRCFERIKHLESAGELLRLDADIKGTVTAMNAELTELKEMPAKKWKRYWPVLTAVMLFLILVMKPWRVEIIPDQEAVAALHRVAILNFDNINEPTDSLRSGKIISNLLISDLAESRLVQVVSEQRLFDVLTELGLKDSISISSKTVLEIARMTEAKWIITGQLIQESGRLTINSQLIDVGSGIVKAAQQVISDSGDNMFSLADKLSDKIKDDLSLPSEIARPFEAAVADITTHSPLAYRYYLEGLDYISRGFGIKAEESFMKALDYDSTMSMAYYYLSMLKGRWEREKMIRLANKYIDRVGWREKYFIRSRAAQINGNYAKAIAEMQSLVEKVPDEKTAHNRLGMYNAYLGQYSEAIRYYSRAIEIDPHFKLALNGLALAYNARGDMEEALKTVGRYIAIDSQDPWPYAIQGRIYAYNNQLDEAVRSFEISLKINPQYYDALYYLGNICVLRDEYDKAESYYQRIAVNSNIFIRQTGHLALAYIPIYSGDLLKAINMLEADSLLRIEAAEAGSLPCEELLRASIYEEIGDTARALGIMEDVEKYVEGLYPDLKIRWDYYHIQLLAEMGRFGEAEKRLKNLRAILEQREQDKWPQYYYGSGAVAFAKKDYDKAIAEFKKAAEISDEFYSYYMLGRSYYEAGKYINAISAFERQINSINSMKVFYGVWVVKSFYYLGKSYEKLNQPEKAGEYYRKFLGHWGNRNPQSLIIDEVLGKVDQIGNTI
jgi:tetratricopeptide (TPR) repeat protein